MINCKSRLRTLADFLLLNGFLRPFPLNIRKYLVFLIDKPNWLPGNHSLSLLILRDWAERDVDSYHRFLWSHHLGYARDYENVNNFAKNLTLTRRIFFDEIKNFLITNRKDIDPNGINLKSIFEVGCSSGYLLRFMETNLFPTAAIIQGIDIDLFAVEQGRTYLGKHGSKIKLEVADMKDLDEVMKGSKYDLIVCAGVLMYLQENEAASVIRSMLAHCSGIIAIAGLAHPNIDNTKLSCSEPRKSDGAMIHNIDAMVENANGQIEYHRWEGHKTYEKQTIYFVFCRPKKA